MISICETVRLQLLRKAIYSILASILHIFQKKFLTEPHTYLYNTLFSYILLSIWKDFLNHKKCDFLEKFILSFFFEQDLIQNFQAITLYIS